MQEPHAEVTISIHLVTSVLHDTGLCEMTLCTITLKVQCLLNVLAAF